MTAKAKSPVDVLGLKNVLGVLGAVGEVSSFFIKHPATSISIGLIASLFIFIWALLEKSNQRSSIKALAISLTILAPLAFILLAALASVLLFSNPPSSIGRNIARSSSDFLLQSDRQTDNLTGKYNVDFAYQADWVEIGFIPSHEDNARIKEISITRAQLSRSQSNRIFELDKADSKTEAYLAVERPSPSLIINIDFSVMLERSESSPKVRLLVSQHYGQRDWVWRLKRWIFEHYGELQ